MSPSSLSGHSAVELAFEAKNNNNSKGPSYWKCNTKTLEDEDFVADLQDLCANCMQTEIKDGEWWENCKVQFMQLIILHSCRLSQNYHSKLNSLETELRELQIHTLRSRESNVDEIKIVKNKMADLLREKVDGEKIRSRAKYLDTEEGGSVVIFLTQRKAECGYVYNQ